MMNFIIIILGTLLVFFVWQAVMEDECKEDLDENEIDVLNETDETNI